MSDIYFGFREYNPTKNCKNEDDSSSTATDSFVDSFVGMTGGAENKLPNAGYPPIIKCMPDKKPSNNNKTKKDKKNREFSQNLSIHQILENRKAKPIFDF